MLLSQLIELRLQLFHRLGIIAANYIILNHCISSFKLKTHHFAYYAVCHFYRSHQYKHLSEDGLVIIVATVDSKTGKVLAGPDLVSRGFVYVRENESLMDGAQSIVETALDRCVDEHVRDWNSVKTRVREALSSYIYRRTKRSPMILPILMEV